MGVSLRNIVREPHRANSLSLAICHRRVYHGRPFLSAPANSPKPTISTPVRPPPRFALQICADRNACTSIWRLSLSLSLPYPPIGSSYSDVTSLSLDRPSLPGIVPIYIYIYMYRKSCRQSSARATTGVVDTVVSRMIRGRLIISSFSIPPSSLYFLFFLFFFFCLSMEIIVIPWSNDSFFIPSTWKLGETYVTGSSDVPLFDCVLFACSYANNFVYGNCNMFNSWKDSLVEGRRKGNRCFAFDAWDWFERKE